MANLTKSEPFFEVEVAQAEGLTVYGGLVALDALARQYGLWEMLRALKGLDLRTDTSHGFSPEVLVAQLVFSLCSGGTGLSDAEKLGRDKTLAPLLGIMPTWICTTRPARAWQPTGCSIPSACLPTTY